MVWYRLLQSKEFKKAKVPDSASLKKENQLGKKMAIRFIKTTDSRDNRVLTLIFVLIKILFLPCISLIRAYCKRSRTVVFKSRQVLMGGCTSIAI